VDPLRTFLGRTHMEGELIRGKKKKKKKRKKKEKKGGKIV
jgi:hypothetical protein